MADELTPDLVRLAYRLILGREPESEAVVEAALGYGTPERLRAAFLASEEFGALMEHRMVRAAPATVPLDAPPIPVETEAGPDAAALLAHVERTWHRLGEERPHWSVLTLDRFQPDSLAEHEVDFYESGAADAALLLAVLRRHGAAPEQFPVLLEYGCGLGRVTAHLARAFPAVIGCDISRSHLAHAERWLARSGCGNAELRHVTLPELGMRPGFDLWFSRIVLQHNPPPVIAMILRRALACLNPGGMAVFQVPTYATGYRFAVREYLQRQAQAGTIEMHVLPLRRILDIAEEAGCALLEIREDGAAGNPWSWLSNQLVLRKR